MKKQSHIETVMCKVPKRKIMLYVEYDRDDDVCQDRVQDLINSYEINNNFDVQTVPSTFRLNNVKKIDKLSKILEDVGLALIQLDHPEIDRNTYLVYCHPMSNESKLRGLRYVKKGV